MSIRAEGLRRLARIASLVLLVCWAGGPSNATPVKFGFSGLHALPVELHQGMNDAAKSAFWVARSELAETLGAELLRLGEAYPQLLERSAVAGGVYEDWVGVDQAVEALLAPGHDVCFALTELATSGDLNALTNFVLDVVERYDGDTNFGPDEDLYWFPDINGSGDITANDWDADEAALQSWANAHRISCLEIGLGAFQGEEDGLIGDGDYAAQVSSAIQQIADAANEIKVMLGGVWLHEDSKHSFITRLEGLDASERASLVRSNVHVYSELTSPDVSMGVSSLEKFEEWLLAAGLTDAERWVGALAVPSTPNADSGGPCSDARCSERTQVAGLVRLVMQAVQEGYTAILYDRPVELVGIGAVSSRTGTGLLVLDVSSGIDMTLLPLRPRPAYAVWRRLGAALAAVEGEDISALQMLPANTHGLVVPGGWFLWYDWFLEVATNEDYDGSERPVMLTNLTSASLRVVSLWPESVAQELAEDGGAGAAWTEELIPVVDGAAQLFVGQDPLWVEPSDELVTNEEPDAVTGDDGASELADQDVGPVEESETAPSSEGGGCASGTPIPWTVAALWLALWAGRRRTDWVTNARRSEGRV